MTIRSTLLKLATACLLAGCAVGPDYARPTAPVPPKFKEAEGWKPADPRAAASDQPWWSIYDDPVLDGYERRIDVSNQTLKASEAAWREAKAAADQAWAGLFPTIGLSGSAQRSGGKGGSGSSGTIATTTTTTGTTGGSSTSGGSRGNRFSASASASWDVDLWGKLRRTLDAATDTAQASEADLAAARLTAETTLATDYFELRATDEQGRLLDDTIKAYTRSAEITRNQYKAGTAARADVITAETQLQSAQSQRIALGVQRTQLEHAIAVLTGTPPADFAIEPAGFATTVPVMPAGVPSTLLERRPDVAEAERKMAAANEQIGIAIAAYFPDLSLTGSYGFESGRIGRLLQASNSVWSFGGTLADTLFDFGAREAQVAEARATWDQNVALYRQAVLAALQQVEDELSALRVLERQTEVEERTVASANEAVRLSLNQYKAGTVPYTTVVTAQATALGEAQTLLTIRQNRLVASATLVEALGGGWTGLTGQSPVTQASADAR
jgi:NodT family efflux transporter outer membrane factor (OMF) lipoprotein